MAIGLVGLGFSSYRQPLVPLTRAQRSVLITLRALTLVSIFLLLCRPVVLLPPANAGDIVIPVLVDTSRSMRIADADGRPRIAQATDLLTSRVLPALA